MKFPEFPFLLAGKIVKKQVKKNKSVIYGARAIKKQTGFFGRDTFDWDILSKKPKKSANTLQKSLDKKAGGNYFYATPSKYHIGTHKVYWKGQDRKRGTKDDVGIADFTKIKKVKTVNIGGIKYTKLSESVKDKRKSLKDKQFAFRHEKDRNDLNRIKAYKKQKKHFLR